MNDDSGQHDSENAHEADADESPSLRQRLHAATGDRDAEAKALRDRSDVDVTERDAKIAVQRARGEAGADQPATDHEMATPADAEDVNEERASG